MKNLKSIFCGLLVALVCVVPAVADNGCENDDNDAIVAELALCSTHAYNIAKTENPTGADKELMRDVIAMKTTLITQQMYRQYEQMESMLRRLKTQLEKAVLTTGLEAKGASSSSSSSSGGSSFKSDDKYVVLAGTENCMQKGSIDSAVSCIQSNVRIVMNAVNAGSTTDARKQLEKDLEVAKIWGIIGGSEGGWTQKRYDGSNTPSESLPNCTELTKKEGADRKKTTISACANELNVQIGLYVDNRNRQAQQKKQ